MVNILCTLIKYINIVLVLLYTYRCFSIFGYQDIEKKKQVLFSQNIIMYAFQFLSFLVMYLIQRELQYLILYFSLVTLTALTIGIYIKIYPDVSRLVLNNMCMLITFGIIMICRLDFSLAVKQLMIFGFSMVLSLIVPVIIRKAKFLSNYGWVKIYAGAGILALFLVAILAQTSGGAKLGFEIMGVNIQPSEFVKIVFVFFVAGSLYYSIKFKNIVATTFLAAAQVLILVVSTDLGAAVILYVVYLVMLYVATKNWFYAGAGILAGAGASYVAYYLFSHIQVRVSSWIDPFASYSTGGYQVAQSLFAMGTGGWAGFGLFQGAPDTIPVAESDFIFSAIAEEMGLLTGLCLILICVSCYVMFLNIAMQIDNQFYKLIALGLGTCYIFQVFLTIGGATKFIPSTGVTLPLVSYGGSSLLSTLIMFAIIQGLYILREDEEEDIERFRKHNVRRERAQKEKNPSRSTARNVQRRGTTPQRKTQKNK